MKIYGCLFTCLSSRVIHIESTTSLSTDAFIQEPQRFTSRRGNVQLIKTDNGTNFVGVSAELSKAFSEMNNKKINEFMLEHGHNMEGVMECKIRSARSPVVWSRWKKEVHATLQVRHK